MNTWHRMLIGIGALGAIVGAAAADNVVYDRTGGLPAIAWFATESGNEITLAGTERMLTEIEVGLYGLYGSPPIDLRLRVYDVDGPEGAPGTILWEGTVLGVEPPPGEASQVAFALPEVEVPDTIVFTVTNMAGTGLGVPMSDSAPDVGTFQSAWRREYDGEWMSNNGNHLKFWARVTAVPEPGTGALAVLAGICLVYRSRPGR